MTEPELTFLFTDIERSTGLVRSLGPEYCDVLSGSRSAFAGRSPTRAAARSSAAPTSFSPSSSHPRPRSRPPARRSARSSPSPGLVRQPSSSAWACTRASPSTRATASSVSTSTGPRASARPATAARFCSRARRPSSPARPRSPSVSTSSPAFPSPSRSSSWWHPGFRPTSRRSGAPAGSTTTAFASCWPTTPSSSATGSRVCSRTSG